MADSSKVKRVPKSRDGLANLAFKTAFFVQSKDQATLLEKSFGTSRFAYNWALSTWDELRKANAPISFETLRNGLTSIKREQFPWMMEVPKDIPAEAIRDLTVAFKNFFASTKGKRKGPKIKYPRRKKKGRSRFSFRLPGDRLKWQSSVAEDGQVSFTAVYLSTIGWVTLSEPFVPSGRIVSATVSRQGSQYFVSFCQEYIPVKHVRQVTKPLSVGIDLGLNKTLVLSSGKVIQGPRSLKSLEKKLADANRKLHKKIRGGKNRRKARDKVADLHARIANIRRDFVEKTTTSLARRYDVIVTEDLNVAGMVKNHPLAKSLSDAAFGAIVTTLERKCTKYGTKIIKVDRFFPSSKQCRKCGVKNQELSLADRNFNCSNAACGFQECRDLHAARNIHHEGLKKLPRAAGEATPVEIWSLPTIPIGIGGKPGRGSRKCQSQGGTSLNTNGRQNSGLAGLGMYDQVC